MKKLIKNLVCITMVTVMSLGSVSSVSAKEVEEKSGAETVEVITEQNEIEEVLKEKGLYEGGKEVVAVIQMSVVDTTTSDNAIMQADLFAEEYYATLNGSQTVVDEIAKKVDNYPGGKFYFEETYNSGYQVKVDAGLDVGILEAAIGVTLNSSVTSVWKYESEEYSYPIHVEVYPNKQVDFYSIYEDDVFFDDLVGWVILEREIGYTIIVTEQ